MAASAEQPGAAPEEDDVIASDTTIEETYEEGMLWTVEDVIAEVLADSGTRHFLVRWTGYELYDATWEPEEHLEPATIKSWEETTKAIERGEKEKFDVADWWACRTAHLSARLDKAKRRDAKRRKRGRLITETAAELEGMLKETLLDEAGFYGIEASELPLDDSDSDVNEAVLPPARVVDLTASPPPQEPYRRTNAPAQPRKSSNTRHTTSSPAKKNRKGEGSTVSSTAGTSASTEQRPKQPPQNAGGRKGAPSSRAPSTTPRVLQPSRQTPTTAPKLQARRTGAASGTQGAGPNIFTSGKAARKRRNLNDLMKDPDKERKLFQKYRTARIAYKQSRDKEDRPPPTASSRLFDISKGPESQRPKEIEGAKKTTAYRQERPPALVKRRTTDDGSRGAEDAPPPPAEKKRKSVTFCDILAMRSLPPIPDSSPRSEPMDIDEPAMDIDEPDDELFVQWRPPSPPIKVKSEGGRLNPSLQLLSVEDSSKLRQTLTIKRLVDFGSEGAKKLEVSLDGIPQTPGEPWFADLMKTKEISFTHTCVAMNLAFQLENIAGAKLGAGNIRSDTASEALENVASRLRLGSFGAVCFRDGYIIVVYPSRCNDWKVDAFAAGATSPSEVDLGYMLFTRASDGNPPPDQAPSLEPPGDGKPPGDRGLVWQRILGFNYGELLPGDLAKQGKGGPNMKRHAFFLVFPPSREAELDAMCLYLRSCDQECLIYTIREGGSWEYFLRMAGMGTIIIQEATTWSLRRLTNVHNLLPASDSRFTFWRATTAMTAHSGVPLGESELWIPPGKIGLHRLLPSGKAILLTPSFLLAQPRRAAQFLIWYSENIARSRHTRTNKIVVACGVCDYVRDVADQMWMRRKSSGASVPPEDCDATEAAWITLRELFEASRSGDGGRDTMLAPIVCAPDELGPTDEQSLVNWFGWWSLMNLDAYRCFIVLGTDETDMGDGMTTTIATRLPTYHPDMVSDPEGGAHDIATHAAADYEESKSTCQRLPNDDPGSMVSFLGRLVQKCRTSMAILYRYPVGFGSDESRLESPACHPKLELFQNWFGYLRPFTFLRVGEPRQPSPVAGKILYAGLFYTAESDFDGNHLAPQEARSRRHPWLAFYRPARWHLLKSMDSFDGKYELIIWDWTTPAKFPAGDDPSEDELLTAQRQLIDFINTNTGVKNPDSVLESVFIGGPESATPGAHPMDLTLNFLEDVVEVAHTALPPTEARLRKANFRKVAPQSQAPPKPASPVVADEDVVHSDVFHPPRGNGTIQPSRCKNLLFAQAQEAVQSRRVGRDGTFSYRFEPTTKWYEQQRIEGRGFEHMLVGRWKAGFDVLGIDKEVKNGGSAGSPTGTS